jgi:Mycobacterium 19 kDa lipoprotein antigen
MIIRRSLSVMVVCLGAALALVVSGCSDSEPTGSAGQTAGGSDKPDVTTIDLTLDGQPVDLTEAALKCYDHEGHLSVEAHNADDPDASGFLMDFYQNNVTLSISVRGGQSRIVEFEEGRSGDSAELTRDGDSVSVTGTLGQSLNDSPPPQPFSIAASCAKFFDTPPDSSLDSSELPSIPATCPPGEVVCIPGG